MTDSASPPEDTPKSVNAAAEAIATGAGVAIGAAAGGPGGAALGAIIGAAVTPYVMSVTQASWQELMVRRQGSVASVIGESADHLGIDPQELVDEAFRTQDGTELLADALHAAAATINQRKVSALARAVANGLADDQALIDEERLVVRALSDLEEPHLALLIRLASGAQLRRDGTIWLPGEHSAWTINRMFARNSQAPSHKDLDPTPAAIMQTLERNGLVLENVARQAAKRQNDLEAKITSQLQRKGGPIPPASLSNPRKWKLSPFGVRVLTHVSSFDQSELVDEDSDTVSNDRAD